MLFSKRPVLVGAVIVFGCVGTVSVVFPQSQMERESSLIADTSLTPHRTKADTGRMAWGRQQFTRYTDPDYCDRTIVALRRELARVPSARVYHYAADTLPTVARVIAEQCGRHSRVADITPPALWGEMRLALMLDNDSTAQDALRRLLSLAPTPTQRRWAALNGIQTYLKGNPPRIALARSILQQLDAEGPPALLERYQARIAFMEIWQRIDLDSLSEDAKAAAALLEEMSPTQRDQLESPIVPYNVLFETANRLGNLDDQETIIERMRRGILPWRGMQDHLTRLLSRRLEVRRSLYGKPVATLDGKYWINEGDIPHPVPERMSLLLWFDHLCGAQCVSTYALIRHLKEQYGEALNLILVTEIRGYAIGTDVIPVDEEIRRITEYYITDQQLPVTLLIDERPVSKESDGRVSYGQTAMSQLYTQLAGLNAILFDTERRVQWIGEVQSVNQVLQMKQLLSRWLRSADSDSGLSTGTP